MNDSIRIFTSTAKDDASYLVLVKALITGNVCLNELLPDTSSVRDLWGMVCCLYSRELTMLRQGYGAMTQQEQEQLAAERTINFIIKIGERA